MKWNPFNTRIGLALGGGAAKGIAHIGALHAFEEEGIQIDYISGTSVGALVATFYEESPERDTELTFYAISQSLHSLITAIHSAYVLNHWDHVNDGLCIQSWHSGADDMMNVDAIVTQGWLDLSCL